MSQPKQMTPEAAARIQSAADRTSTNQGFKRRAQAAASRHSNKQGGSKGGQPGKK